MVVVKKKKNWLSPNLLPLCQKKWWRWYRFSVLLTSSLYSFPFSRRHVHWPVAVFVVIGSPNQTTPLSISVSPVVLICSPDLTFLAVAHQSKHCVVICSPYQPILTVVYQCKHYVVINSPDPSILTVAYQSFHMHTPVLWWARQSNHFHCLLRIHQLFTMLRFLAMSTHSCRFSPAPALM